METAEQYVDDQWRDILNKERFSPVTKDNAGVSLGDNEVWRGTAALSDWFFWFTVDEAGDPIWVYYIGEEPESYGHDSVKLLSLFKSSADHETANPPRRLPEAVSHAQAGLSRDGQDQQIRFRKSAEKLMRIEARVIRIEAKLDAILEKLKRPN
jgi:hypothetical protein